MNEKLRCTWREKMGEERKMMEMKGKRVDDDMPNKEGTSGRERERGPYHI